MVMTANFKNPFGVLVFEQQKKIKLMKRSSFLSLQVKTHKRLKKKKKLFKNRETALLVLLVPSSTGEIYG
jgi:hypothetical protein